MRLPLANLVYVKEEPLFNCFTTVNIRLIYIYRKEKKKKNFHNNNIHTKNVYKIISKR